MKKRMITLLLTAALGSSMVLAGCAGSQNTGSDKAGADTKAADTSSVADTSSESDAAEVKEVPAQTITLTTTYSETEYAGDLIKYFGNQLSELSGGAITLDVYWGGTVAATGEELSFVGSGGMDMSVIGQSMYTDTLSLLNFPSQVLGGYEDSVKLIDYIAFENETTSPLIQDEIESNNVHMIGSLPGGSNAFITAKEYTSLDEMKGLKIGIGMNQSAMEMLGLNVVTMMPWDYYDQLSRGMADAGYMSVTGLISMSLQEVMPYFLKDGTYTAGNLMTVNLDKWNSFDDNTKAVFEEAMEATQAYSYTTASSMDDDSIAAIEAQGGALNVLSEEDAAKVQEAFFTTGVSDARTYAEMSGKADDMEVILQEVADYIGLEVPAK